MKKLMKIATVLSLNFLVLSYSLNNFYSSNSQTNSKTQSRGIASTSDRIVVSIPAKKVFSFNYKDLSHNAFSIKKEANSYEEAFKLASHDCFQQLTSGKYPGEEKGLDIIDICANPKI